MTRSMRMLALLAALGMATIVAPDAAQAARYKVGCIAPNGPWCRIFCQSNRTVACYANVINRRCVKTCRYY